MDGEVDLGEVVGGELDALELLVGGGTLGLVFCDEALGEATAAVLAGAASLTGLGLAFEGCI